MASIKIKNDYADLIKSIIILVIGILFCFSKSLGEEALSIILGIAFILVGAIAIVSSIVSKKPLLTPFIIVCCVLVGFGVFCIKENIVATIFKIVPWTLLVIGGVAVLDAILLVVQRREQNKIIFVFELLLGIAFITLGILLLTVPKFQAAVGLIFGIALIVYGLYQIVKIVIKDQKKTNNK